MEESRWRGPVAERRIFRGHPDFVDPLAEEKPAPTRPSHDDFKRLARSRGIHSSMISDEAMRLAIQWDSAAASRPPVKVAPIARPRVVTPRRSAAASKRESRSTLSWAEGLKLLADELAADEAAA